MRVRLPVYRHSTGDVTMTREAEKTDNRRQSYRHIAKRGVIEVSPRAIASIARMAAMQSYGIVGLSHRIHRSLRGLFIMEAGRKLVEPGVAIGIVDRQIVIDLYVVIEYGTRISEVASNVASGVQFAVEHALGLPIVKVNVNVQGVRISRGA